MKAIVQRSYGDPRGVLAIGDAAKPVCKSDEVLVRVRAAGINWADWSAATGRPLIMRLGYGLRRPRRPVGGIDGAGIVEAVGNEVDEVGPGDEVFGSFRGSFAEYAVAKAKNVVAKPPDIGFEEAAAVPTAALVALQALRDVGNVQPGQKVLVNGASGGIGTFTVQIAKSLGAEVTGVCSTPNLDLVRSLGADHVIDYTAEDFTKGDVVYDFIIDMADNRSLAERRRVLTRKGTLVPNSGQGGRWFGSLGRISKAWLLTPFVSQKLRPFLSLPKPEDLEKLAELMADGSVKPVVGATFAFEETAAAVALAGDHHVRGKAVVTI